jgi:hypothetical protein
MVVAIMQHKLDETDQGPEIIGDPESPAARELRLEVLTSLLCMVMERRLAGSDSLEVEVGKVSQAMGTKVPAWVFHERDWAHV